MAFSSANMALIADGNNKKLYFYSSSADTIATIVAADYFLSFTDQLAKGDVIVIQDSGDNVTTRSVAAVSSSSVTVQAMDDQKVYLTGRIADISTAGQVYLVSPVAGKVTSIRSVIAGAIATADATLTGKIGGTAITGGTITVANSGSAAGDTDVTGTISGNNTVAVGDNIEVETDGASTTASECTVVVEITPN